MGASGPCDSSSSDATVLPPSREGDATRQYDWGSDKQVSSIDEKRSSEDSHSSSSSSTFDSANNLLLEARELEAQPELKFTPPEDLVPRRTKIIFVALYFFLNLSLTLSNKSVLSRVSAT